MERLAVVIATYERPEHVIRVVADARAQLPEDGELLVVDQSSPPARARVRAALPDDPRVRMVEVDAPSLPHARNVGIRETRAPVILFLDDDVLLLEGCLDAHLAAYASPRVGGVVGRIVERTVRWNARRTTCHMTAGGRVVANLSGREPGPIALLKGANMSFRREALVEVGGFDRNYLGNALLEDADASRRVRRAGWALLFEPAAELVHLSAPRGGVRVGGAEETERWRFHNTGYYVRRHRGLAGAAPLVATFTAIALRRAAEWGDPPAAARLLRALGEGWRLGSGSPALDPPKG